MTDQNDINFPMVSVGDIGGASIQTVNARHLHAFLKVGKDFSTWIKDRIEQYDFLENVDFVVFPDFGENPQGGRPTKEYAISLGMAKELAMVEKNDQGKKARLYFIECERRARSPAISLPNFSDPVVAARAWADEREARMIAERTKAEIGTRREATAMNTASRAVKKASALEQELDRSKAFASVKRMSMLYHGQTFDWRRLKRAAIEIGKPAIDVFDANYGTVKAYHADVWRKAYALEITDGGDVAIVASLVSAEGDEHPLH